MTDEQLKKALECCNGYDCETCRALKYCDYMHPGALARASLDLINRQKAEIERLSIESETLVIQLKVAYEQIHKLNMTKSEAIKKFAEELKNYFSISECYLDIINIIDNLVKEMME